jgi:hypothetical protein
MNPDRQMQECLALTMRSTLQSLLRLPSSRQQSSLVLLQELNRRTE